MPKVEDLEAPLPFLAFFILICWSRDLDQNFDLSIHHQMGPTCKKSGRMTQALPSQACFH